MTDLDKLERDARRPDYGSRYYKPAVVLALIEDLRKTLLFALILLELKRPERGEQIELFPKNELSTHQCGRD